MRNILVCPTDTRLGFLPLAVLAAGCSGEARQPASVEQKLSWIGVAYNQVAMKAGRPPRGSEELEPVLQRFGDPQAILVSGNDGQPFTIHWGVSCFQAGPNGGNRILAHESVGAGGKKYVLDNMLGVRQMTEAELDQALQMNR